MKVLIADDTPSSRMLLQHTLERWGYDVIAAADGCEAMEALRSEQDIRIAILDWIMPGLTGLEVCEQILELGRFVHAILLTGREESADLEHALTVGAADYIVKPFRPADLRARIKAGERVAKLQVQLSQSQKLESIGQLAAGIAHEINTPIQFVGDNVQFLEDSFGQVSKLLEKYQELRIACESGSASARLVAEVSAAEEEADLDYLREEIPSAIAQSLEGINTVSEIVRAMKEFSHPGTVDRAQVDLNKSIESTLLVCRNEWKYIADVKTELDAALPFVPCLVAEINQAMLNIIVNATHAIEDAQEGQEDQKGTIRVCSRLDGDWAEVSISDTGNGIPADVQERIFDPFFTTKEVGRGSGQGLAIARSVIVDKHGGTIQFETEAGVGTTFRIRLPLEAPTGSQDSPE